ncbi:MAG TPA: hypothetical protein VGY48_29150 [Vicinamibacterales bacterium]|jgi:hypothetical protein|nr:hypothetical protein [Vicinamibacterales bacterium]
MLIDQGYISFPNTEDLLVVPEVRRGLLDAWGIDVGARIRTFNSEQREFHRYF